MEGLTPGKIALLAVAVVSIGVSTFFMMSGGADVTIAKEIIFVDVKTGELFSTPYGGSKSTMIPQNNPDTGEATLFRVIKDETSGEWRLITRYTEGHEDLFSPDVVVNPETGELNVNAASNPRGL